MHKIHLDVGFESSRSPRSLAKSDPAAWAPALQTPPKFHEKTPRENTKSEISSGRRTKKAATLRPPAFGSLFLLLFLLLFVLFMFMLLFVLMLPTLLWFVVVCVAHVSVVCAFFAAAAGSPTVEKNPPLPFFDLPKCWYCFSCCLCCFCFSVLNVIFHVCVVAAGVFGASFNVFLIFLVF